MARRALMCFMFLPFLFSPFQHISMNIITVQHENWICVFCMLTDLIHAVTLYCSHIILVFVSLV